MKFVKVDDSYIDLSKIVSVSFLDDDLEIRYFAPGFENYVLYSYFDNKKDYLRNKRDLIKDLIKCSIDYDCEVVEC